MEKLYLAYITVYYNSMYITLYITLQDGYTPLYMASMNGYDKIVKILTTAEADVNIADKVSSLIFNKSWFCERSTTIVCFNSW